MWCFAFFNLNMRRVLWFYCHFPLLFAVAFSWNAQATSLFVVGAAFRVDMMGFVAGCGPVAQQARGWQ